MFMGMVKCGPDTCEKVKGVTVLKPMVYGSIFWKEKRRWAHLSMKVHVKPHGNEMIIYH
jgi:hypothetical protein